MFWRFQLAFHKRLVDYYFGSDIRQFAPPPRFDLFSHRIKVPLHPVNPNRDAVDERERLRVFREHRVNTPPMAEMTDDVQNQKLTLTASTFSRNAVSKVKSQRSRYVSYKMRIASCHADLRVLGHKMVNDTKAGQLQDARCSRASSGAG